MTIADRLWLSLRLTICYLAGFGGTTIAVTAITWISKNRSTLEGADPIEALADVLNSIALLGSVGVVLTWPLFLVAVVAAFVFARSVVSHPAIWGGAAFVVDCGYSVAFLSFGGDSFFLSAFGAACVAVSPSAFMPGVSGGPWPRRRAEPGPSLRLVAHNGSVVAGAIDMHIYALSLYFVFCNFVRAHRLSPAMAAGVADRLWETSDIAKLVEACEPAPSKRGSHKKRIAA